MSFIWGIPYLFIKIAVGELTPASLVFLRTAIGAALLLPIAAAKNDLGPLLPHWKWIAAYTLVPEEQLQDMESAKRLLGEAGVEGVVSMRIVARDEQATVVPGYWTSGPYYGSFSSYWGYGWGTVYDPGYIQTDTIVSVETLVYSFRQDKLVWAGMSETMKPSRADALVSELAGRVASEMEKDGLLVDR